MTKRAIAHAQLATAVQFSRLDIANSTLIPTDVRHYEAEFTAGRIADIHCYGRDKLAGGKYGPWKYEWSIPSVMVKAYRWVEEDIPKDLRQPKIANAESEAEAVEGGQASDYDAARVASLRS